MQVGSDPSTAPRYYYVYNAHGDVVNLADASGNIYASYSYDEFGAPLTSSESFPGGWTNPYRYDGRDDVRYDSETALYWMSVRAYDPTLGRFIARDPLGRAPLNWASQPYVYAGNNPSRNVDPSGQRFYATDDENYSLDMARARARASAQARLHISLGEAIACNPDSPSASDNCIIWGSNADKVRKRRLDSLDAQGEEYAIAAAALDVAAIGVARLTKNKGLAVLEAMYDLLDIVATIAIPAFGKLAQDEGWGNWAGPLQILTSLINHGMGLVELAIGWWKGANWLVRMLLDGVVLAVKTVAEGVPGELEDVTVQALGGSASLLLNGFAGQLLGNAYAIFGVESNQYSLNIADWCAQYGGGQCGAPPTD